jgi:superfamily I DNA/RNA helicase
MHGAKGLQGDDVHLILSLSPRAWAEAAVEPDHLHRLLYTAVTRTKENLYLYDGENGYELPSEYR